MLSVENFTGSILKAAKATLSSITYGEAELFAKAVYLDYTEEYHKALLYSELLDTILGLDDLDTIHLLAKDKHYGNHKKYD